MKAVQPIRKTMQYMRQHGIVRPRDIEAIGVPREYLLRLHRQGKLNRLGRGIYVLPDAPVTERHSYAAVMKRVPEAILCLLSALAFHELTTQNPSSVWIALRSKQHSDRNAQFE
jgi:predicted transcriptional regulator of viral defense system